MGGGLTYDGRYVTSETGGENLADLIETPDSDPNFLMRVAQRKPVSVIDRVVDWIDRADNALFARYGQDWWLGVAYRPAVRGYLGSRAQSTARRNGERVNMVLREAFERRETIYKFVTFVLNLAYGGNEKYEELLSCAVTESGMEDDLNALKDKFNDHARSAALGFGKRIVGGYFVRYATTGGKYGKRMLGGNIKTVRRIQMPVNLVAATWGSWLRVSMKAEDVAAQHGIGASLGILDLVNSMLTGSSGGFALTREEYSRLLDMASKCGVINEQDREYFDAIIILGMNYYSESE